MGRGVSRRRAPRTVANAAGRCRRGRRRLRCGAGGGGRGDHGCQGRRPGATLRDARGTRRRLDVVAPGLPARLRQARLQPGTRAASAGSRRYRWRGDERDLLPARGDEAAAGGTLQRVGRAGATAHARDRGLPRRPPSRHDRHGIKVGPSVVAGAGVHRHDRRWWPGRPGGLRVRDRSREILPLPAADDVRPAGRQGRGADRRLPARHGQARHGQARHAHRSPGVPRRLGSCRRHAELRGGVPVSHPGQPRAPHGQPRIWDQRHRRRCGDNGDVAGAGGIAPDRAGARAARRTVGGGADRRHAGTDRCPRRKADSRPLRRHARRSRHGCAARRRRRAGHLSGRHPRPHRRGQQAEGLRQRRRQCAALRHSVSCAGGAGRGRLAAGGAVHQRRFHRTRQLSCHRQCGRHGRGGRGCGRRGRETEGGAARDSLARRRRRPAGRGRGDRPARGGRCRDAAGRTELLAARGCRGEHGMHAGAMRCGLEAGNCVPSSDMDGGVVFVPGVPGFPPGAS